MKKQLSLVLASSVVLLCVGVAVVVSDNHKTSAAVVVDSQVQSLQKQLKSAQAVTLQHDAVSAANQKNYADQITGLTNQKAALCAQIKAARLAQPICQ